MGLSKSQLKYMLTNFRTRRSYFFFQIFQLFWSLLILVCAFLSPNYFRTPYILYMELVLLICMAIDLLFIRMISEGGLWTSKNNKIDCIVLLIFTITFLILCFTAEGENDGIKEQFLETDDIILILVIVLRYGLQIFQMVKTIKNTRKNMKIQKEIKDIDLNQEGGHSVVYDDHDLKQDEIVRSKITQKHRQQKQSTIP